MGGCSEGPAISVLMCARNAQAFVSQAIAGILAQTFADFELLVVDDASTDTTSRLIQGFSDPRIKVLRNKENVGIAASRNIGLAASRAPIVAIADADDVSSPSRLEEQKDFLDCHPEVGLLGCYADVIDADGAALGVIKTPLEDGEIRTEMKTRAALVHPTVAMRRALLVDAGGYRAKFVAGSDYDMLLRVSEKTRMATVPAQLCRYRLSPSSISVQRREAQRRSSALSRRFADERARGGRDTYEELPESEFVDSVDRADKGAVMSRYHVFAGKLAGAAGNLSLARRHFSKAIVADPLGARAYALLLVSLAGRDAYQRVQKGFGTTEISQG